MKRLLIAFAAATMLSAPALAQHQGHTMPMPKAKPKPVAKPAPRKPAAKPAARKPAAKAPARAAPRAAPKAAARPAVRKPAAKPAPKPVPKPVADPHAGHQMPAGPPVADPHAGHQMPPAASPAADPHAGHAMPVQSEQPAADPHAGHDMGSMAVALPAPPVGPPPPAALSGPAHAADLVFGAEQMGPARAQLRDEHGNIVMSKILIDQLEAQIRDGKDGYKWDGQAWYGGDIDKFWVKAEGEGAFGASPEQVEVQALWSHAIDPWFDLQAGARYDFRPDPERAYLVLGVQGLAPYWFEVDAAAFISDKGDISARFEAEYDLRFTQKLILQPRVEFDLALQDVPEIGVGSGLSTAEAGVRLRYEIMPEFAPYIGLEYQRAFGDTRDYRRLTGEDTGGIGFMVGIRTWF